MAKHNVETLLEALQSSETSEVEFALTLIQDNPTGDSRIRKAIESLLSDRRITILSVKPTALYGELACSAGEALTYEYAKVGIEDDVVLQDAILPLQTLEIYEMASKEEIKQAKGELARKMIDLLTILSAKGKPKRGSLKFFTKRAEIRLRHEGKI